LPHNRICFTFPRGFGNAVARNRAKRLGREAFRLMNSKLLNGRLFCGYDLILLVYPETDMALSGRLKQFESLFNKAGLLK
jgi:ribonuclease P protein component